MQKRRFILFDFDGVIADSYSAAFKTARTLCVHITDEEYRGMFEGNADDKHLSLMSREHGPECQHDLDWFSIFIPAFEDTATIVPGMVGVVKSLSTAYVLIIVSSSITSPIQGFLEKHHIGRYFSEIMGADVHTSKQEKIRMVFANYTIAAPECVFITDTLGDMLEAKAAGVGAIGVSWGFHSKETLGKEKPFRIVDAPVDIPSAIAEYFARV